MLTVSLHGIHISAPHGLYAEEPVLGNEFEIDIDVWLPVSAEETWPFVDYTEIHGIVKSCFEEQGQLLETFVRLIHAALKLRFPEVQKIKVTVRKLHPPMQGDVRYAQVCYEDEP
jgi:dihydroneopterin aldolase